MDGISREKKASTKGTIFKCLTFNFQILHNHSKEGILFFYIIWKLCFVRLQISYFVLWHSFEGLAAGVILLMHGITSCFCSGITISFLSDMRYSYFEVIIWEMKWLYYLLFSVTKLNEFCLNLIKVVNEIKCVYNLQPYKIIKMNALCVKFVVA